MKISLHQLIILVLHFALWLHLLRKKELKSEISDILGKKQFWIRRLQLLFVGIVFLNLSYEKKRDLFWSCLKGPLEGN